SRKVLGSFWEASGKLNFLGSTGLTNATRGNGVVLPRRRTSLTSYFPNVVLPQCLTPQCPSIRGIPTLSLRPRTLTRVRRLFAATTDGCAAADDGAPFRISAHRQPFTGCSSAVCYLRYKAHRRRER